MKVWWAKVPEKWWGGGVTEGWRAHGRQGGCGFSELKGGGGAEGARGMVNIGCLNTEEEAGVCAELS